MPMRVGFVQHRMRLLQEELEKIIGMLPQLGVKKAILLNPLYRLFLALDSIHLHTQPNSNRRQHNEHGSQAVTKGAASRHGGSHRDHR